MSIFISTIIDFCLIAYLYGCFFAASYIGWEDDNIDDNDGRCRQTGHWRH